MIFFWKYDKIYLEYSANIIQGGIGMIESEKLTRQELLETFTDDAKLLLKYVSWLQNCDGQQLSANYDGEGIEEHSMSFPIYDSKLLAFMKDVKRTKFLNKNYVYTYSKYIIKTDQDEKKMIEKCTIRDIRILGDILSKYAIKGSTISTVWKVGVQNGVYLAVILKLKEVLEIHKY